MSTISSPGVGSGLDVNTIVTKLVEIEKRPLTNLQTKATQLKTQLSLYGTIKSQMATLGDAAAALASPDNWKVYTATSSNTAAVNVTASASASPTTFSLDVTQMARAQTAASKNVTQDATLGTASDTGTLNISLGSWATGTFVGSGSPVSISVNGNETLTQIAAKINDANAGVTATVLRSGGQERLLFQSSTTGAAAGFQIASSGFAGLDALSLTNLSNPAESSSGMQLGQTGLDAVAKLNGVEVKSATNTLSGVVPGLTIQLSQLTSTPAQVTVSQDQTALQAKIQALADAFTTANKTLTDATKYVPGGVSGPLQGDSTTVGIQNVLSSILGSNSTGSVYSRLSEIGLERQTDGSLKLNTTKLSTVMSTNLNELKKLFTTDNSNQTTNGFGLKLRDFARGLNNSTGTVTNKTTAIQGSITRNTDEQGRVNDRAARVQTMLLKQYSSLDTVVSRYQGLNSYVSSQIAQWNKN